MLESVFELLAAAASGLFAGAAAYVTLVQHPVRLEVEPSVALTEFRAGFPRARTMQASLAAAGAVFAALAWLAGRGSSSLVVAVLLSGVIAYTLVRIRPIYDRLLDPALAAGSPEAAELLVRWPRLHRVRTVVGLVAFAVALAGL